MRSFTNWITPFTSLHSLNEAIQVTRSLTPPGWTPSLLLPTHFGQWPQGECRQSLPADMLVRTPADVATIRVIVESQGLGFGAWGVPVDSSSPELAASFAAAAGYYVANFEPAAFWVPGDNAATIDDWWGRYWTQLGSQADELSGNTAATVVPNAWGLSAFESSLQNLADGCGALMLEVYGGLQDAALYPSPNLWPAPGFAKIRATGVDANLIPILATANLTGQLALANRLGHGNVHCWCS